MQWQKPMAETCFCRTGLNRFKPRFKPPLAETCQPCMLHDWIGLCSVLRPRQHSIGYVGDGFYRSKDQLVNVTCGIRDRCLHDWAPWYLADHLTLSQPLMLLLTVFIYDLLT